MEKVVKLQTSSGQTMVCLSQRQGSRRSGQTRTHAHTHTHTTHTHINTHTHIHIQTHTQSHTTGHTRTMQLTFCVCDLAGFGTWRGTITTSSLWMNVWALSKESCSTVSPTVQAKVPSAPLIHPHAASGYSCVSKRSMDHSGKRGRIVIGWLVLCWLSQRS